MPPKDKLICGNSSPNDHGSLRAEAEAKLDRAHTAEMPVRTSEELLHELQVHQIELEMQNETLRQATIALEESRDRYVDIYDFAPNGYFTLSRDARITEINLTAATLLGEERGKLVNSRFVPFVALEDADRWHLFFRSVLNCANRLSCELILRRVDGTSFYAQLDCQRQENHGNAPLVRIALADISERRKMEVLLQENQELLSTILKMLPVGLWIIDADGKIVFNNDAAHQIWAGARRVDIARFDEYKGWKTDSGKQIGAHEWAGARAIEKGETTVEEEVEIECFDGSHKIILDSAVPLRKSNGDIRCAVTVNYDITARKQLEASLRTSEKRRHLLEQQEIVQTSLDGFWVVNSKNGQILEVNETFCKMMGYSREEILAMSIQDMDVVETPEETEARIKKILEIGYDRFETRHRHKQGHLVDFDVSVSHSEVNGGVNYAFFRDITERNRTLEALKTSEGNYRNLFDNSHDAMMTMRAVPPIHFISANHSAVLMFEAKSETDLIGKKPWELSPERQPDGLKSAVKAMQMIEISEQNGFHSFEWIHKRLNGETFPAEILLTRLKQDGLDCIQATIRDITDRKRVDKVIKQSRDQLMTFIKQAPISIAMFDLEMNYLAVSDIWLKDYGRGYADLIGLNHYAVHPDIPAKWKIVHQQALGGVGLHESEDTWIQSDGSKQYLRWAVHPWTDVNKNIGGIIISTENITDTKLLEMELIAHRNEMDQLQKMHVAAQTASAIAHEMNQPLLAIASYNKAALMMMQDKSPDHDEIYNAIQKSEEQALRAGQSIRDLIEFLSMKDFVVEPFDFNKEIIEIVGAAKSVHNLAFHSILRLEEGLPFVLANRTHVQKVLLNLLHNGTEAMQIAGVPIPAITITVCTTRDKSFAQMTIYDNGPGVNKENINRLFEPFFTTKTKGIGMGLAISRSLIEENGGQLWVDPQEGPGATFHLTLPLAL